LLHGILMVPAAVTSPITGQKLACTISPAQTVPPVALAVFTALKMFACVFLIP
jgi:hypothetical protein